MADVRDISPKEQLDLWVEGTSVHLRNEEDGFSQCCPDFSCCVPELLASKEERDAFAKASEAERSGMLMMFLGAMLDNESSKRVEKFKIHITGDKVGQDN